MDTDLARSMFILADNRLTRESMTRLLTGTSFRVDGTSSSLTEFEDHMASLGAPDILLVDLFERDDALPRKLKDLGTTSRDMRIVILTDDLDLAQMADYFESGVHGFLLKDISAQALLASLELTLIGERVFPAQLIPLLLRGAAGNVRPRPDQNGEALPLSARELSILRCLVEGNPNKVIAQRLDMAEATIKVHIKNILRKIKAENRTQAAIWALNHGIESQTDCQHPGR